MLPPLLSVLLVSCGTSTTAGGLKVQVVLSETSLVAGQPIKGTLLVTNPGGAINLTAVGRPFGKPHSSYRCQPAFLVYLTNGVLENEEGFDEPCVSGPFTIAHGVSRWHFQVLTTFSGCTQSGGGTENMPACSGPSGTPPLPPGSYDTRIAWSEWVPLPDPRSVTVELLAAASTKSATTSTTAGPPLTRHDGPPPSATPDGQAEQVLDGANPAERSDPSFSLQGPAFASEPGTSRLGPPSDT